MKRKNYYKYKINRTDQVSEKGVGREMGLLRNLACEGGRAGASHLRTQEEELVYGSR